MEKNNKKTLTNNLLISVIIPVYNSIDRMERLLKSINNQKYKNFEIIFIDDGSEDGSYEYLNERFKADKKVSVYKKEHAGPGPARKFGYEKSHGGIVVFIDSDDWFYSPDALQIINDYFITNHVDACLISRKLYPSGRLLSPFSTEPNGKPLKPGVYGIDIFYNRQVRGTMSAKIFKREILKEDMFIGSYNFEDMLTTLTYLDHCSRVLYSDKILQVHNNDDKNRSLTQSSSYMKKTLPERINGIIEANKKIKSKPLRVSLANLALDAFCNYLKQRALYGKNKKKIRELERIILEEDLSSYYYSYSLKKRMILRLLTIKGYIQK